MELVELSKKLKDLRAKRGMSQEYLAEESKVSLRTIQRMENNESKPTGETIKRVASALGVKLEELVDKGQVNETSDLESTIIFLKQKLAKTRDKSEVKTLEKFISLLKRLKLKGLNLEQKEDIESYIQNLELEKIPSFNGELYKEKLSSFKKFLRKNMRFVPRNYYTTWACSFAIAFVIAFAFQENISFSLIFVVAIAAISLIAVGIILDFRINQQERSFSF